MRSLLLPVAVALFPVAFGDVVPYGQCGGMGFTGPTSCRPGSSCKEWNPYYSQCIPNDPSATPGVPQWGDGGGSPAKSSSSASRRTSSTHITTSVSSIKSVSSSKATSATSSPSSTPTGLKCQGSFSPVSAQQFFDALNPGWNLGNTLDAIETEGSWNNPPVTAPVFKAIKDSGYLGMRLPVTWAYHFATQSPTWDVDPKWLARVEEVVDMSLSTGFWTIVNVHHDSWVWADVTAANANITAIEERFYRLWYQIGTKLACKSSKLAFEPINEPPGSTPEHGAAINRLNVLFLKAINDARGFNGKRVVTLVGAGEDGAKTSQWFKVPAGLGNGTWKNPWGIQYHYYSPYDFIFQAWGKTTWGSSADKAALEADIAAVRGNFTGIPLVIGEWAASPTDTETAARWKYFDFFLSMAKKYKTSTMLWDSGVDFFDRGISKWRDTVAQDILTNAVKGSDSNSLPESSTEGDSETQQSSAYIYHKLREPVTDVALPFQLNGNILEYARLVGSETLMRPETDYSFSQATGNITFKASFLSTLFSKNVTGSTANITLVFNAGADLLVNALQWDTPALPGATTSKVVTGSDLHIPVQWKGQSRPAAVRAVKADGGYLIDDWTQWLPVLQKGRLTYYNHWKMDANSVILTSAVMDAVKAANQNVVFTLEFYPRTPGNSVNYTITV